MTTPRTVRLTVAYDGTDFSGWQLQPRVRTVQGVLTEALFCMEGKDVAVVGAGRTDAGVHAHAQVAHFHTTGAIPDHGYVLGLNVNLPLDVAVTSARTVEASFHARYQSRGKFYRYQILRAPTRLPQWERFTLHRYGPLRVEAMQEAAKALVGRHDFQSFRSSDCDRDHALREIWRVDITEEPPLLLIDVEGGGFLKNMVRIIVGTLLVVGVGRREPSWVAHVLEGRDRRLAGPTVPPQGLCLEKVFYDDLPDYALVWDRQNKSRRCEPTGD